MTADQKVSPLVSRKDVAKGAALAGVARLGAVIEALSQPLFIWLFGLGTYGVYVAIWAAINFLSNIVDFSMTLALQRVVPTAADEEEAHAAVKSALIISVLPALFLALILSANAAWVAGFFSAAPEDVATLPHAITIFAWALPLWTFVEVSTAAVRSRRGFGPEIRLRIFWEQIARILFALTFALIGFDNIGLMAAHLCSLFVVAGLCVPLLARFFDLNRLIRAPLRLKPFRDLYVTGLALLPSNLSRRLLIDLPPVVLNMMLPGARGATAAGLFEIARKISTVPLIVRRAFQYVLAPLSSAQAHADRAAVLPLYRFVTRVSAALVVPLSGLLIFAGADILSIYRKEAAAALPLLYLLLSARALEAIVGPAITIVEMTGHRLFPVLNSFFGLGIWAGLTMLLVPQFGGLGMAVAVGAATIMIAYSAAFELRISDGITPLDGRLLQGMAISGAGVALMALVEHLTGGPARFALVLALWAMTSWLTLRYGLARPDREALGAFGRALRLVASGKPVIIN